MLCEYDQNIYKLSRQAAELVTEGQEHPYWCYGSWSVVYTHAPLSQTRRVSVDMAQRELYWMLSGSGATQRNRCARITPDVERMWSPWATDELGPMYGVQWRYGGLTGPTTPYGTLCRDSSSSPQPRERCGLPGRAMR